MRKAHHLTTGQIAKELQVSSVAVQRWIKAGKLKAFRTPGGHFRVRVVEFQRFVAFYGLPEHEESRRILVVDDDPSVVEAICSVFYGVSPTCKVQGAFGGYDGLLQVGLFRPHLLVLDLRMPELDGLEVCRRVKANPDTQSTKIVALTAYPDEYTKEEALRCGADGFLVKPFEIKELMALVGRLIG